MSEALKNIYTREYIKNLAFEIRKYFNKFNEEEFINSIFNDNWDELELKKRIRHIALIINKYLPLSYKEQIEILKKASKRFSSFEAMFFQDFVEVYGLDDCAISLDALEVFTIDSSSEFAIRQFILKYEDETQKRIKLWTKSENEHLRRLASEGCRPRLPWAIALLKYKIDPTFVFEIIEELKNDESVYVQKSVANNLNDISKDNEEKVIDFVVKNLGKSKSLNWICKHGSRTMLKKGNKKVLELFGYKDYEHIKLEKFILDENVKIGGVLHFSFNLYSKENIGNLRLEYAIEYLKANGSYSKKVFMILQNNIKSKDKKIIKKQSFKNMTTRKHYLGLHKIAILINGKEFIKREFNLIK